MRSIHKASVSFGLVNVPVKLYGATEEHDVKAHQIHSADGGRVRYRKVCEACDATLETADISRGYEYGKQLVSLTEDDLAPMESNHVIEVLEFVPASDLDPMLLDKPYYLAPEKGANKAYALLATTLKHSERVGLIQFSMRGKTRLAALKVLPKRDIMVAHTLRWPDEVREPDFTFDKVEVDLSKAELAMASQLVEAMANSFNADRYRDVYQEELRELIAAKAEGVDLPIREVTPAEDANVADLLARLKASTERRLAKK